MSDDDDDLSGADLAALMDSAAAMRPSGSRADAQALPEAQGPASCSGRHHTTPSALGSPKQQVCVKKI